MTIYPRLRFHEEHLLAKSQTVTWTWGSYPYLTHFNSICGCGGGCYGGGGGGGDGDNGYDGGGHGCGGGG